MFERKRTCAVKVGQLTIGDGAPIVVQSMTDTKTSDIEATVRQVIELVDAGSEIVRITVNDISAAKAVPYIRDSLHSQGCTVPLVGCFHYNAHTLLTCVPECAQSLDKFRINPGNIGTGLKHDSNFEAVIECALKHAKPIRIGVNGGSLDEEFLSAMMDANAKSTFPKSARSIICDATVGSALQSARRAEELGLNKNQIVISAKVSNAQDLIWIYEEIASQSDYALHLGLTEAGPGSSGIISVTAALSVLLHKGIGDTIRASITQSPGESRTKEVAVCRDILQSLDLRRFSPSIIACPGCGRTKGDYFKSLAEDVQQFIQKMMPSWQKLYPGIENMKVAVMGCIVNGPGESKHANIGISLPGDTEEQIALVFVNGKKYATLYGNDIADQFKQILVDYVKTAKF